MIRTEEQRNRNDVAKNRHKRDRHQHNHFIVINNDYFKSINKATITLLDICGGSGNLSWELLKDNHQFATEKK